jgi:hypothetical protein
MTVARALVRAFGSGRVREPPLSLRRNLRLFPVRSSSLQSGTPPARAEPNGDRENEACRWKATLGPRATARGPVPQQPRLNSGQASAERFAADMLGRSGQLPGADTNRSAPEDQPWHNVMLAMIANRNPWSKSVAMFVRPADPVPCMFREVPLGAASGGFRLLLAASGQIGETAGQRGSTPPQESAPSRIRTCAHGSGGRCSIP